MTNRISPTPWRVERGIVIDVNGTRVATPDGESLDGERANARLIAAAPELLAVLRLILRESDRLTEAEFQAAAGAISNAED